MVTLSVTEAEEVAVTECVQDMLLWNAPLGEHGLKFKKPMILTWGAMTNNDIVDSWSTNGHMRHIVIKHNFCTSSRKKEQYL